MNVLKKKGRKKRRDREREREKIEERKAFKNQKGEK